MASNEELKETAEKITKTVIDTAVTETKKGIRAVLCSMLLYILVFLASATVSLYAMYYAADWSYDTMCKHEIIQCVK